MRPHVFEIKRSCSYPNYIYIYLARDNVMQYTFFVVLIDEKKLYKFHIIYSNIMQYTKTLC